jgi:hypothetical protein
MNFQGTTRTDPCERNYPTRLLPWMSGVKTHARERMQDTRTGNPTLEGRAYARPAGTAALTATAKHRPPQIAQPVTKAPHSPLVVGNRMIAKVASNHTFQPRAHRVDRLMHPQTQLCLNGSKRRSHPLRHSPTLYDEMAVGGRRTIAREPKKREGLWFDLATLLPIDLREPTKLDQSRLLRMEFQREARQPFPKLPQKPLSVFSCSKPITRSCRATIFFLRKNRSKQNFRPRPQGSMFAPGRSVSGSGTIGQELDGGAGMGSR